MGRIAPAYYVQDGVIPRTRLSEVLREIDALAAEYELRVANVFHAGDGNLHPLVCYDAEREGEAERAEELSGLIIKACVDAGGSITGEHGVGVDKKAYMPSMFGEADLEAFQRLRCAFDPHGLANPGKVMPTPRLCGEVPGPVPRAPARARRRGGALLSAWPRRLRAAPRTFEEAAAALAAAGSGGQAVRIRGGGTKLGWGRPTGQRRRRAPHRRSERDHRAQRRRPDRDPRGRRAPRRGPARRSPPPARCSRSTRRSETTPPATIGGIVATGDSGPLRHRYGAPRDSSSAPRSPSATARSPARAAR